MSTRPYAILIREANGDRSREQAAAQLDVLAGAAVQLRAGAAGGANVTVRGTVAITDAVVASLDTRVLYVGNGDAIEEINFTAAGINTRAEFVTALAALQSVTASLDGSFHLVITGKAGNDVTIEGSNDATTTALGIEDGIFDGGPVDALVAGYVPFGTPGAIEGTAAISPADVKAGEQGTFFTDDITYKDELLVVDPALFDEAVAELRTNGLKARETIVL